MSPVTDPAGREHPAGDSAGVPWAGRSFSENSFGADDGSAPPSLAAAMDAFRSGESGQADVVSALSGVRLLIPLVTRAGETDRGADGRLIDKTQELAIVTVAGPDGRPVLPVFTSVEAMGRWRPEARPVPADARRVALAAADEGVDRVVVDPATDGGFVVRRAAIRALALGESWREPWRDAEVVEAVRAIVFAESAVLGVDLVPGDPRARLAGEELVIRLGLAPGLDRSALDGVLGRISGGLSASEAFTTRVDSVALRIVAAPSVGR